MLVLTLGLVAGGGYLVRRWIRTRPAGGQTSVTIPVIGKQVSLNTALTMGAGAAMLLGGPLGALAGAAVLGGTWGPGLIAKVTGNRMITDQGDTPEIVDVDYEELPNVPETPQQRRSLADVLNSSGDVLAAGRNLFQSFTSNEE